MANKTLNVTLIIRNDTSATLSTKNPVLQLGEMCIETDTRKFKFGDGTTAYNSLKYASGGQVQINTTAPTASNTGFDVGTLWINTSTSKAYILMSTGATATWVEVLTNNSTPAKATSATKLETARKITMQGDVNTISNSFDGTNDISFDVVLKNSGVTAGTYTKLTVNAKGIITAASTLTAADIPTITLSKISDAGTAAAKNVGTAAGNIPLLNANGKLEDSVLPALAISDTFVVSSQKAMLELDAQRGDVAVRTDENKSYILKDDDATKAASWVVLKTPDCKVLSVNGKTGAVVLSTTDIAEGTHLYFTEARATANFTANIAETSITSLKDGSHVLLDTDTFTIDGGKA